MILSRKNIQSTSFPVRKDNQKDIRQRDMSNDYAEVIKHDFSGHVDIIIGTSMGGMIAQHFAADYPQLFDHIVIAIAAHKMSDIGKKIDYKFAQLLSQGKTRSATATIVDALYPLTSQDIYTRLCSGLWEVY